MGIGFCLRFVKAHYNADKPAHIQYEQAHRQACYKCRDYDIKDEAGTISLRYIIIFQSYILRPRPW